MADIKVNKNKSVIDDVFSAADAQLLYHTHNPYIDAQAAIDKYFKDQEARAKAEAAKRMEEEWIWVSGYKATDSEMKCRDYQYELGKKFDMPDGEVIIECQNGFHLCRDLDDVFQFYSIGNGNRFFEVQALVRKSDYDEYGAFMMGRCLPSRREKLVAKSIIFTKELTADQILTGHGVEDWTDEEKAIALKESVFAVIERRRAAEMVKLGYSEAFAKFLSRREGEYETAKAVAAEKDLSMDMKVLAIMRMG